MLSYAKAAW